MNVTERELKILAPAEEKLPFELWYSSIRDPQERARVRAHLTRVQSGNLGDYIILGDGVCGFRIYHDPGGKKSSQQGDILTAPMLWKEHKDTIEGFQCDFFG